MKKKPTPFLANWFITHFIPDHLHEEFFGDLEEIYQLRVSTQGSWQAGLLYWVDACHLLLGFISIPSYHHNPTLMYGHYLRIACRNLFKNKAFTLINLLGLVLGMSACLHLVNYITFEKSFDSFYPHSKDIYRITHQFYQEGQLQSESAAVYSPMASAIQEQLPEVLAVARIHPTTGTVRMGEGKAAQSFSEESIYFTDSSFFDLFPLEILSGSADPLHEPNWVVLTEKTAKKYFGRQNPIGRTLAWQNGSSQASFTVRAIMKEAAQNSHLSFDLLFSFSTLESLEASSMIPLTENWGWPGFYTYLQVRPAQDVAVIETKINDLVDRQVGKMLQKNGSATKFYLQPLTDIHLHSAFVDELSPNGDASMVQFLGIIAVIVLVIAYINYVNLSTVKSLERAREVGIRKVMGSGKGQVVLQFIIESMVLNGVALLISLLCYYGTLPFAGYFTSYSLSNVLWESPYIWPLLAFLLFLGPLLANLYPSMVLASYKPVSVLKGHFKSSSKGILLRKSLVILQYGVSLAMFAGTLIVFKQIQYMRSKDLGVNLDQVFVLKSPTLGSLETIGSRIGVFKQALLGQSAIGQVSSSSAIPGAKVENVMMYKPLAQEWKNGHTIATFKIDTDFLETYQAKVIAGRSFSKENTGDIVGETMMMNEAASRLLGFSELTTALGQKIVSAMGEEREVIGIVKNHHQHSLVQAYEPLLFILDATQPKYVSIKISLAASQDVNGVQQQLKMVETTYKQHFPNEVFDGFFIDHFFDGQYQEQIRFSRLFSFFSSLAIIVACLGFFGLASYTTLQRRKEMGIRKVLGAGVKSLMVLLLKEYLGLMLIAMCVAIPTVLVWGKDWLDNFAFRIEIGFALVVVPGLLLIVISFLTVSYRTYCAAKANPVDSLRIE